MSVESPLSGQRRLLRSFRSLVVWIVVSLPAFYYLVELPNFGHLPYNDYYEVLFDLTTDDGFRGDLSTWFFIRSNEHHVTLPSLVYLVNYWVTGGDNRGHSVVTLALIFGCLFLLSRWIPANDRKQRVFHLSLLVLLSTLLFNPVQSHNVVKGFSGVMWLLSNFFAIGAMSALAVGREKGSYRTLWVILLATAGAFSYSSNLTLWPALLVGCLVLRVRKERWLAILGATVAAYSFYLWTYTQPSSSPALEKDLLSVVRFTCAYLGSLFSSRTSVAICIGALGILVSTGLWLSTLFRSRSSSWGPTDFSPWIMLWFYAFANAIGTAVGRAGFADVGIGMAFSSRYANLAALFWVGWVVPLAILLVRMRSKSQRPGGRGVIVWPLVFLLAIVMFNRGDTEYRERLRTASQQPLADLAARYRVDHDSLYLSVTPWPYAFKKMVRRLDTLGHLPFGAPTERSYGQSFTSAELVRLAPNQLAGAIDSSESSGDLWVLEGWIRTRGLPPVQEVLLLDYSDRIRGFGFPGFEPVEPVLGLGEDEGFVRWRGIAKPIDQETLWPWVQLKGRQELVRMPRVRFEGVPSARD